LPQRIRVSLFGSALLAAYAVASLPWSRGWRWPRTPFDASASASAVASGYVLLRNAAGLIPQGSSVTIVTAPRDPIRDAYFHRFGVSLLPHARVLPAGSGDPEFVVVVGSRPAPDPGDLLLDTPEGSVWRRRP
jgi:hypothetical protein